MTDRQTDRQTYYKNYYQNNKDKYKTDYRRVRFCSLCEKEFVNITRHQTTQLHKFMVKKNKTNQVFYDFVRDEPISSRVSPLTNEPVLLPSVM